VISSVAGDRVVPAITCTAAQKRRFDFLSGLRQRLNDSGINVSDHQTRIRGHADDQRVQEGTIVGHPAAGRVGNCSSYRAPAQRRLLAVVLVGIMQTIKQIPEFLFRRLKL